MYIQKLFIHRSVHKGLYIYFLRTLRCHLLVKTPTLHSHILQKKNHNRLSRIDNAVHILYSDHEGSIQLVKTFPASFIMQTTQVPEPL